MAGGKKPPEAPSPRPLDLVAILWVVGICALFLRMVVQAAFNS
jgi:hypothetical protein